MGINSGIIQEPAGPVHCRQLAAGPQARVDAKDPLAPCRRGQEQVSEVVGKYPDGRLFGALLRLEAKLNLDGLG